MSEVQNPPLWFYTDEPLSFDSEKLGRVKPTLAPADDTGYGLSVAELKKYFGIDAVRFGKLPKRMIIPVLHSWNIEYQWYRTEGYLYLVEPVE
ncbi:uncharacterized protein ColSpa_01872 [Colletotrichum spaethianum]|uniref:Uncharacterized protein n=1 Tax=Colletotrichum spaethianum TaxID=700344 RepID=A0AA37P4P0_9PEZI|nr:uncharacterized protein ColSpa_01872 [Colletotrichum spaethianum]GKT41691.1 hypothetical protein ColSpa_01872 [Colletotrichum spaethianum]